MELWAGALGRGSRLMPSLFSFQVVAAEPPTVLDALQQRLNKYREAGIQARGSGDERKARMHERIAKVGPQLHDLSVAVVGLALRVSVCLSLSREFLLPQGLACLLGLPLPARSLHAAVPASPPFPCSNIRMPSGHTGQDGEWTLLSCLFRQVSGLGVGALYGGLGAR